ncbi:MAG: DUF1573 domain-containing protein [Ginsengibacter sp.]
MKKLLFAALLLSSTSIFAQKKADDIAKLSTETYDFGKVKQNVPPTATITVTNIGTEPLIIDQATPSCGCTVSDYTKSPIAPGKTGTIKATYNAAAVGPINKTLTVKFAGADDVKFVKLTGEVLTPAAYDALKTTKESVKKTAKKEKKEVTSKS